MKLSSYGQYVKCHRISHATCSICILKSMDKYLSHIPFMNIDANDNQYTLDFANYFYLEHRQI